MPESAKAVMDGIRAENTITVNKIADKIRVDFFIIFTYSLRGE